MRATVTVISVTTAARADVSIESSAATPVADVLDRLTSLIGVPPQADLSIDGFPLDPLVPLGASALRDGSIVTVGAAGCAAARTAGATSGYLELRIIGGPVAGSSYQLQSGDTIIGRGLAHDFAKGISLDDSDISRRHLQMSLTPAGVTVADTDSTNGTQLDGQPIGSTPVALLPGMRLRIGESTLSLAVPDEPPVALNATIDGGLSYNRPPRLDAPDPGRLSPVIEFPPAPAERSPNRLPLIATAAPLVMGVLLAVVMRRPEYLLFTVLSPVMMVGQWLSDRVGHRKQLRVDRAGYAARLASAKAALNFALAEELCERRHRAPDAAALLKIAEAPSVRLWERRRADADFLQLCLGTGTTPARVRIGGERSHTEVIHQTEVPQLDEAPIPIELTDVGVLGLAGESERVRATVRFLLGQLAVLHSPGDLGLVLLTESARAESWEWLRWLPHLRSTGSSSSPSSTASLATCQVLVGLDADTVAARVGELAALIQSRKQTASAQLGRRRAFVVIVDGARALRHTPGLAQLLANGPGADVFSICLDRDESSLPEECGAVAITAGPLATRLKLRITGQSDVDDIIADGVDIGWAERLARALAPLRDSTPGDGADTLPDAVRWIELAGIDRNTMSSDLVSRWARHSGSTSGTTRALVGSGADGPLFVDIARDGPHALVAGTTGSGKSELLQTLVASLACANRPDELTFVLVDYKGGAAFGSCAALPHTVGMVTDLDGGLVERALVSLAAELKRRESLLATLSVADIDAYRGAGGHLARLVIVVDEFASLAEELPEFVGGLVGIAQRGRSLGVHLVLATQRPEGVVSADIRANTNLRICLAVTGDSESRDVIDTPDAARISRATPGRGYLRTGHGELRAFQAARVGGVLDANSEQCLDVQPSPFRALAHPRIAPRKEENPATPSAPTDLDLLVTGCREAAARLHIQPPPSPWLAPLLEIAVSTEPVDAFGTPVPLAAIIGVHDVPAQQARQALLLNLAVTGHLLISGSPRSGRTTVLRTMAGAFAQWTPLRDLHLYVFDCAGGGLAALDALPHCGGVVAVHEPERARRMIAMLSAELARRQTALASAGFGSITEQRAGSSQPLPHIVVAVDGWESFIACYEDIDCGAIINGAYTLLREGAAVGIHLIVAADRAGLVGRLASVIDNRLVLRLADRTDFSLIGLAARSIPATMPPGRGYWANGLLETQMCVLPTDPSGSANPSGSADPSGSAQLAAIAAIAAAATIREGAVPVSLRPRRVDPVPTQISLTQIASTRDNAPPPGSALVTLGVGGDELRPIIADLLATGPGFVISGPPRSGRSTALATIAANLRSTGWRVLAITPRPSPLREFVDQHFDPADPDIEAAMFSDPSAPGHRPLAVLVDDAELVTDSPAANALDRFARHARDAGNLIVIGGTTEDLAIGFRGFIVDTRRSRSGVLLTPRGPLDGELLGVRLPRGTGGTAPPGRGLAVSPGGITPLQIALPT